MASAPNTKKLLSVEVYKRYVASIESLGSESSDVLQLLVAESASLSRTLARSNSSSNSVGTSFSRHETADNITRKIKEKFGLNTKWQQHREATPCMQMVKAKMRRSAHNDSPAASQPHFWESDAELLRQVAGVSGDICTTFVEDPHNLPGGFKEMKNEEGRIAGMRTLSLAEEGCLVHVWKSRREGRKLHAAFSALANALFHLGYASFLSVPLAVSLRHRGAFMSVIWLMPLLSSEPVKPTRDSVYAMSLLMMERAVLGSAEVPGGSNVFSKHQGFAAADGRIYLIPSDCANVLQIAAAAPPGVLQEGGRDFSLRTQHRRLNNAIIHALRDKEYVSSITKPMTGAVKELVAMASMEPGEGEPAPKFMPEQITEVLHKYDVGVQNLFEVMTKVKKELGLDRNTIDNSSGALKPAQLAVMKGMLTAMVGRCLKALTLAALFESGEAADDKLIESVFKQFLKSSELLQGSITTVLQLKFGAPEGFTVDPKLVSLRAAVEYCATALGVNFDSEKKALRETAKPPALHSIASPTPPVAMVSTTLGLHAKGLPVHLQKVQLIATDFDLRGLLVGHPLEDAEVNAIGSLNLALKIRIGLFSAYHAPASKSDSSSKTRQSTPEGKQLSLENLTVMFNQAVTFWLEKSAMRTPPGGVSVTGLCSLICLQTFAFVQSFRLLGVAPIGDGPEDSAAFIRTTDPTRTSSVLTGSLVLRLLDVVDTRLANSNNLGGSSRFHSADSPFILAVCRMLMRHVSCCAAGERYVYPAEMKIDAKAVEYSLRANRRDSILSDRSFSPSIRTQSHSMKGGGASINQELTMVSSRWGSMSATQRFSFATSTFGEDSGEEKIATVVKLMTECVADHCSRFDYMSSLDSFEPGEEELGSNVGLVSNDIKIIFDAVHPAPAAFVSVASVVATGLLPELMSLVGVMGDAASLSTVCEDLLRSMMTCVRRLSCAVCLGIAGESTNSAELASLRQSWSSQREEVATTFNIVNGAMLESEFPGIMVPLESLRQEEAFLLLCDAFGAAFLARDNEASDAVRETISSMKTEVESLSSGSPFRRRVAFFGDRQDSHTVECGGEIGKWIDVFIQLITELCVHGIDTETAHAWLQQFYFGCHVLAGEKDWMRVVEIFDELPPLEKHLIDRAALDERESEPRRMIEEEESSRWERLPELVTEAIKESKRPKIGPTPAAFRLQRFFRCLAAKKKLQNQIKIRNATKIQAVFRGHKVRRDYPLEEARKDRVLAMYINSHQTPLKGLSANSQMQLAAVRLQQISRRHLATRRRLEQRRRQGACDIQRNYRTFRFNKVVQRRQRERDASRLVHQAASQIQATMKMYLTRSWYLESKDTIRKSAELTAFSESRRLRAGQVRDQHAQDASRFQDAQRRSEELQLLHLILNTEDPNKAVVAKSTSANYTPSVTKKDPPPRKHQNETIRATTTGALEKFVPAAHELTPSMATVLTTEPHPEQTHHQRMQGVKETAKRVALRRFRDVQREARWLQDQLE